MMMIHPAKAIIVATVLPVAAMKAALVHLHMMAAGHQAVLIDS